MPITIPRHKMYNILKIESQKFLNIDRRHLHQCTFDMVLFNLGAKNVTSVKVKSDFGSKGFNDYLI